MTQDAFVFPGQGSQMVGMGRDVAQAHPAARETFQQADDLLGFELSALCFDGPEIELNDTINTQPALYVCSIAILRALQAAKPDAPPQMVAQPSMVAGHSLGEITALTAAGALPFEDGLRLVRERGRLMKEADTQQPGAMAAILGLDADVVRKLCSDVQELTGRPVVLANDNCPGQIVISGDESALEAAMQAAQAQGARKVVRLPISIAAHSPLMEPASAAFAEALASTPFEAPQVPVYANATAAPVHTVDEIRQLLSKQLIQPVRWTESVQAMIAAGATRLVEIGSGDVLTGLTKRIDRGVGRVALNSLDALEAFTSNM